MSKKLKITLSIMTFVLISLPSYSFDDESCLKSEYKTTIKKLLLQWASSRKLSQSLKVNVRLL